MRRIALILILAAAVAASAAAARADVAEDWDTFAGVSFYPFTVNDENPACIPWVDPSGLTTRNCDPVNVLFPNQTIDVVQQRLAAAGWTVGLGSHQRLHYLDATTWPYDQLQMVYVQDDANRYHVRLWQVGSLVIGAVHHDFGLSTHVVDVPWDVSEAFLATALCSSWCQHVTLPHQQAIQGGPLWRGLANDGVATVVPLTPPPPPPVLLPKKRHKLLRASAASTQ
jgi:hypothetical protein